MPRTLCCGLYFASSLIYIRKHTSPSACCGSSCIRVCVCVYMRARARVCVRVFLCACVFDLCAFVFLTALPCMIITLLIRFTRKARLAPRARPPTAPPCTRTWRRSTKLVSSPASAASPWARPWASELGQDHWPVSGLYAAKSRKLSCFLFFLSTRWLR